MNQRRQLQFGFVRKRPMPWKSSCTENGAVSRSKAFSTTKTGRVWLLALKEAGTRMESQGNKPSPLTGAFFLPKGQNQDHRSWFRNLRYCVTTALCSRPASARCLRRSASTAVWQEPPLPIYFVLGRHVSKNTAALRPPRKACFPCGIHAQPPTYGQRPRSNKTGQLNQPDQKRLQPSK
jgi:hypothetical protein